MIPRGLPRGDSPLTEVETRGYGIPLNAPPQQGYSKAGKDYKEEGLEGKVVSCVSILNKSLIEKQNAEENQTQDIYDRWANILMVMNEESEAANYNTIGHNCCSVAYYAAWKARAELSSVNPKNFNLVGMGIIWGQTLGNATDYLTLLSSSSGLVFKGENIKFTEEDTITKKDYDEKKETEDL